MRSLETWTEKLLLRNNSGVVGAIRSHTRSSRFLGLFWGLLRGSGLSTRDWIKIKKLLKFWILRVSRYRVEGRRFQSMLTFNRRARSSNPPACSEPPTKRPIVFGHCSVIRRWDSGVLNQNLATIQSLNLATFLRAKLSRRNPKMDRQKSALINTAATGRPSAELCKRPEESAFCSLRFRSGTIAGRFVMETISLFRKRLLW